MRMLAVVFAVLAMPAMSFAASDFFAPLPGLGGSTDVRGLARPQGIDTRVLRFAPTPIGHEFLAPYAGLVEAVFVRGERWLDEGQEAAGRLRAALSRRLSLGDLALGLSGEAREELGAREPGRLSRPRRP